MHLTRSIPPRFGLNADSQTRQQASLYHHDKYEHLASEMKKIASARMADINTDFSRIKGDMNREEAVASL